MVSNFGIWSYNLGFEHKTRVSKVVFAYNHPLTLITYKLCDQMNIYCTWKHTQLTFRNDQWILLYKRILQYPGIKGYSFPPGKNICEFHVKITSNKYVLRCPVFSSSKTRSIGSREFNTNVSVVYRT